MTVLSPAFCTSTCYEFFIQRLQENPICYKQLFQQDAAPHHFVGTVKVFLNQNFPKHWIGQETSKKWTIHSSNLKPLLFISGVFKK
jgi:hypothetical protein